MEHEFQVNLELSQDNCASSAVYVFTDVERLHLIDSWEVVSEDWVAPTHPSSVGSSPFRTEGALLVDIVHVEISCGAVIALSFTASHPVTGPATSLASPPALDLGVGSYGQSPLLAMATMDASTPFVSIQRIRDCGAM